jgi:hypothetical protein
VQDAGIEVLLIPGNHDIDYNQAYEYVDDKAKPTDNISQEEFKEIASSFGYDTPQSKDENSFSYSYELNSGLQLLFLDANTSGNTGTILDETLDWAKKALEQAQQENKMVISISHQNVLAQNSLLSSGFVINNHEEVQSLLEEYQVNYHFSGHSHIQHTSSSDTLTDTCIGSLAVSPLRYDVAKIDAQGNVSISLENLDILQEESADFFDLITRNQVETYLEKFEIEEQDKQKMIDFAVEMNRKYFSGENLSVQKDSEAFALWDSYAPSSFWYGYLNSMMAD